MGRSLRVDAVDAVVLLLLCLSLLWGKPDKGVHPVHPAPIPHPEQVFVTARDSAPNDLAATVYPRAVSLAAVRLEPLRDITGCRPSQTLIVTPVAEQGVEIAGEHLGARLEHDADIGCESSQNVFAAAVVEGSEFYNGGSL